MNQNMQDYFIHIKLCKIYLIQDIEFLTKHCNFSLVLLQIEQEDLLDSVKKTP